MFAVVYRFVLQAMRILEEHKEVVCVWAVCGVERASLVYSCVRREMCRLT